ncbi:MAG: putative zinc-binding metallopeptidase [Cyclobacteriaceae bacterium]
MKKQSAALFTKCLMMAGLILLISACYPDETLEAPVNQSPVNLETDLDIYIEENFRKEFGMAIRYRYDDRFVRPTQRVTPPKVELVRPMLDFIQNFWVDPFLEVENGEVYFRGYVPAEVVLLGGLIYNADGTVTLGTADAGAQITFTNVNQIDLNDPAWVSLQLQTVYHEFAHIVHQRNKLPTAFEEITPSGYTSAGSWFNLTDEEALTRGFVTPYATSSPNEDFAETVAVYLYDADFDQKYLDEIPNCTTPECEAENLGKESIRKKLVSVSEHYQKVVGINLEEVRMAVQARL